MEPFGVKLEVMDQRLHRMLHFRAQRRHHLAIEAGDRAFGHLIETLAHDPRRLADFLDPHHETVIAVAARAHRHRSEEHTSELQSLMRISYAVFCLKKKKN